MSEDEFNAAIEATRRGVAECMREYTHPGAQTDVQAAEVAPSGLGGADASGAPTALTGAANGWSINGPCQSAYGIARTAPAGWTPLRWLRHQELLGGAAYGEQCADTDGLARYMVSDGHEDDAAAIDELCGIRDANTELLQRIARKEAANEALVAKLNATMADAQSLQRQNEHWQAECRRLSALLVETREELARRMALPSNALRHGGVR